MSGLRAFVVVVVVAALPGCGSGSSSADGGELEAFCELAASAPPTDAFREPGDEAARAELREHVSRLVDHAPRDLAEEARRYERSVERYLDGLAAAGDGSASEPLPPGVRAAEREQREAGEVLNAFIDERCF